MLLFKFFDNSKKCYMIAHNSPAMCDLFSSVSLVGCFYKVIFLLAIINLRLMSSLFCCVICAA